MNESNITALIDQSVSTSQQNISGKKNINRAISVSNK